MKKMSQWFNQLTPRQQKLALFAFCALFTVWLLLSIRYQSLQPNSGHIIQPRIKNN